MNWDTLHGNWSQMKGEAKRQWGKLTDDDLKVIEGNRDKLVGRIRELYGMEKDAAERDVDTWVARH